jgi:hypothetical protein
MMQSVGFGTTVIWALDPEPGDLEARLTQAMENFWRGIAAERAKSETAQPATPKANKSAQ